MKCLWGTFLLVSCSVLNISGCADENCTIPDGIDAAWTARLGCQSDYTELGGASVSAVFADTLSINWIIDREDDHRVYFINNNRFRLHYDFAAALLNQDGFTPVGTHGDFNLLNYRSENRRFVLGKLVQYLEQDILTLEFSAGDSANVAMIVDAFSLIRERIYDGQKLLYRPVSGRQESMLDELEPQIPTVRTDTLFRNQTFQPLNSTIGYGTLRFARVDEFAVSPPLPTEIVVLDRVPNDLSVVSGIITAEFQTPLSHINILSKNRGTPNMALRDAFEDPDLRALEGQLVRLEVAPQSYDLQPTNLESAQAFWEELRPSVGAVLEYDLTITQLVELENGAVAGANHVGSKAANIALLSSIPTVPLPEAPLAIPFSHYADHVTQSGADELIASLLATPQLSPTELQTRLFEIRWQIFHAPLASETLSSIMQELRNRWDENTRVRFRSSTNAEDLPEFSGAGLYTSASATPVDGADEVADAIRMVWASTWNYAAFVERDFYRIDHRQVFMGVLVHPAFTNEQANGVALTVNEFAENRPAYFINTQVFDISVANPTGFAIPEQLLYYTWYQEPEYEIITRSSLVADLPGWPHPHAIMTDNELTELASYLEAIHSRFLSTYGVNTAVDIEFKLDATRQIIIKQARPYSQRR